MFDDDVTLGEAYGLPTLKRYKEDSPLLITNDALGIEVELENCHGCKHLPGDSAWEIKLDGSLRNNGREFVFLNPISGERAVKALDELEAIINQSIGKFKITPERAIRSSVHVHVDCTDLTSAELTRLLLLYMIYEIPLFKAFAEERYGNHFCFPLRDCIDLLDAPRTLRQGWDSFNKTINHPNIGRYCALNLKSLFKFGSVEFRHHGGEWEKNKLLLWINACLAFKRAARVDMDIRGTYFEQSFRGFEPQLREIFPRQVAEKILKYYGYDVKAFNKDVIRGILIAQHAVNPRS
jgi:hypothetical protein